MCIFRTKYGNFVEKIYTFLNPRTHTVAIIDGQVHEMGQMNLKQFAVLFMVMMLTAAVLAESSPKTNASATHATTPASNMAERQKTLNDLFEEIFQSELKASPEFASSIGEKKYNDQLDDQSVKAFNHNIELKRVYLERLTTIDSSGMSEQEQLSKAIMLHDLESDIEGAKFKPWQMPLSQFYGEHVDLPREISDWSFETIKDYDDYIVRLHQVPRVFTQIMSNLLLGMEAGRVPPKYLLEKVQVQVDKIAGQKAEDSPFAIPIKNMPATISPAEQIRIRDAVLKAITSDVLPTYTRLSKFLAAQYVPAGRVEPGIWSLPDGDAYYAFRVKESTTLDLTPEQVYQIGLQEVASDEKQMFDIVHKLGYSDLKSFNAALQADPKQHFASAHAVLDAYKSYIDPMRAKLPELFGRLPKAKLEVVAMPDFIAKDQAAADYENGTPDGSRPGRININTYNFAKRLRPDVETVAYHEGIPGHHLQISIAQELTGLPKFRSFTYYTAYTEGWALYSERLGKEVGFYKDPYSDYGRVEADMWRSIRLVVDTGVHYKHWTRQQMVDYFHEHSTIDDTNVQAEVDRYIAWPGQALGYKIGQLSILHLRDKAQQELGDKFDIRGFHDAVIDSGALPMNLLEQRVDQWIAEVKAGGVHKR